MGIVKTNASPIGSGSSSGGLNSGVDLPTHLSSISSNGGNKFVTLTLGYSNTNYITGVQVNYKTGSYPTSPSDGQSISVLGAAATIKITGLTNKLTYYFRVFLYNEVDSVKCYQTDITNARITGIPRGVEINGITPLVSAADHIVIVSSCTFTLSAPAGTRIILGGGGAHTAGGYVSQTTLTADVDSQNCTLTLGSATTSTDNHSTSTLKIGTKSYTSGSSVTVINSKWGPIGGDGGFAYHSDNGDLQTVIYPTGAGGGGGGYYFNTYGQRGGNNGRYGNYGGNGGYYDGLKNNAYVLGSSGASGKAGAKKHSQYGTGGGGGYSAGGGRGAYEYDVDEGTTDGGNGYAGSGILVIEWD